LYNRFHRAPVESFLLLISGDGSWRTKRWRLPKKYD